MGTKVHLPGYHPMVDLNDDSNISTWPVYYGENKSFSNGQFHDLKTPRTIADAYFGYHTEAVKQKMLEHEATFQTQLRELHRVYRVQRGLMDDLKMNELQKQSMALDTSMSSCSASQQQDAPRWLKSAVFPFSSSSSAKPAVLGAKDFLSAPIFSSGKSSQYGLGSPNNTGSSKDSEVEILEYSPLKARRKFDLELRANEYIDVEEPKPPELSSYPFNRSCEDPRSGSGKMSLGQSIKINGWNEARRNRGENGLADLNRQIRIQGMNSSFNGFDSNFRSKHQEQTHPGDYMQNSYSGRDESRRRNLIIAQNENRRGFSHMLDAARSNGHTTSFSLNSLPEDIDFFNKDQGSSCWKEGSEGGPKHSGICSFSGISNPRQSDRSFLSYKAPWINSGSCVTQKSVTADMHPCFNSTSTLRQSFAASNNRAWPLSEGWHVNSGIGSSAAYQNGSGPGRCATSGIYAASGGKVCLSGSKHLKGLTNVDASSAEGIDLNVANGGNGHECVDSPNLNRAADLPWLKASAGLKNGNVNGSIQSPGSSSRIMGVPIFGETHLSKGALSCQSSFSKSDKNGTVRGFDINLPCEDDEKDEKNSEMPSFFRRNHIDLNLCVGDDSDSDSDDGAVRTTRGFDLEAFGDIKDEDISQLNQQIPEIWDEGLVKVAAEAIVVISSSRKLIPLATAPDALEWFVDIISCPDDADKVDQLFSDEKEETDSADYFEYMTLNLPEMAKEEYLPEYPNPPVPNESTTAGPYTVRTRKGQARRGRPRRDFQSDILPGLTSLSRHEVTEDLQTLGGLMRATGQSWQSTLTQRTRPRRGRPRLTPVQPPYLTSSPQKKTTTKAVDGPVRMEDHRSLTGWGKSTRRPRGQRCATGNASAVHIA